MVTKTPRAPLSLTTHDHFDSVDNWYEIDLHLTKPLFALCEGDYVDEISGNILLGEAKQKVGTLSVFIYRCRRAIDEGAISSLIESADSLDEDVWHTWETLFKPNSVEWKRQTIRALGDQPWCDDLMLINRVTVDPAHQGRGVGLAAVTRILDVLGSGIGVVAIQPAALQFQSSWLKDQYGAFSSEDEQTCTDKVRKHWEKLGFRRVGRSKVYVLGQVLSRKRLLMD